MAFTGKVKKTSGDDRFMPISINTRKEVSRVTDDPAALSAKLYMTPNVLLQLVDSAVVHGDLLDPGVAGEDRDTHKD